MATDVTMPKLSDTMTEGKLVSWKKSPGERIERGEIIAEVETDKANMELEAFASGVVLETRAKPGDTVRVGEVIAVIGEEGEGAKAAEPPSAKPSPLEAPAEKKPEEKAPGPVEETKEEREMRRETGLGELGEGVTAATEPEAKQEVPAPVSQTQEKRPQRRETPPSQPAQNPEESLYPGVKASPLVRRLAREKGVELSQLSGSGPEGRITRDDLERLPGEVRSEEPLPYGAQEGEQRLPVSKMRGAIARKVTETWQSTPHFAVTVEIDMADAERLLAGMKQAGQRISLNDLILKGAALALQRVPEVKGALHAGEVAIPAGADIGVAVALQEGLLIPVVRGCDRRSLPELATESRRLVEKARSGKISEGDLQGGSFTVSNLGMYGVDQFFAVINSPQAAILAVGAVLDRPVVRGGRVEAGRTMKVTLSADHRLLDGAVAARFLDELREILQNPVSLLI